MDRRARSLLAIRLLLVSNGLLLVGVGALLWFGMEHPPGVVGAALCWTAAAAMFLALPLTDPYRRPAGGGDDTLD